MKHLKYFFFLPASVILIAVSCTKSTTTTTTDQSGNWVKRADFGGVGRTEGISFVIGDTAYVGTGFDGFFRYNDLWAFTPDLNSGRGSWSQRSSIPAPAGTNGVMGRNSAVAFTINNRGYVTTGTNGFTRFADTWEFNPATNSWTQKADFPEGLDPNGRPNGRFDAVAFAIGNRGYVTTGFNGSANNDLYIYDAATDKWTQGPSLGGEKRSAAVAFVFNGEGYVVTGIKNGQNVNDFWKYNPSTGWSQLRNINNASSEGFDDDYTDIVRNNAVAFTITNGTTTKAYITTGKNGTYTSKTWEYNFTNDTWVRKSNYERSAREGAVAFTVKGRGYVANGTSGTFYLDDCDELKPDETLNSND
ncbi:MAG: Kelch repeat-containing protein [Chitinophagaceae bacterium]